MSKIQQIKRKDLNLEKYSETLQNALNYRIYAEYWYLDVLTNEKWECLVYGDYEVVMPIPLQYKFGFKFVIQPLYCQQLGVFYQNEISKELFDEFKKSLHEYRVRAYNFNEENTKIFQPAGELRPNYLLGLEKDYSEILEKFERDRKKDIRRNQKHEFNFSNDFQIDKYFELLKSEYPDLAKSIDLVKMRKLIETLIKQNKLKSYTLLNDESKVISICLFAESAERIILLFSARDKELETKGAFAYLLNYVIETSSAQNLILDFEGSMIEGIAKFNSSFGAEPSYYTAFSNFKV